MAHLNCKVLNRFFLYLGRCQGVIPPSQFEEQHQAFYSDQKRLTTIKSVHEELALQWVVATSTVRREAAANNSRFEIKNIYSLVHEKRNSFCASDWCQQNIYCNLIALTSYTIRQHTLWVLLQTFGDLVKPLKLRFLFLWARDYLYFEFNNFVFILDSFLMLLLKA